MRLTGLGTARRTDANAGDPDACFQIEAANRTATLGRKRFSGMPHSDSQVRAVGQFREFIEQNQRDILLLPRSHGEPSDSEESKS